MASRQLRKLRKQQELQGQLEFVEKSAAKEESSDDEPVVAKPRTNPFAGFAALHNQGDDDDDEEEAKSNESEPAIGEGTEQLDEANTPAKKKKKKNKKKKGKKSDVSSTPRQGPAAAPAPEQLDEIDKALEELKIEKPVSGSSGPSSSADPDMQIAEHFHISFQHLKTSNELRRMFGNTDHLVEMEEQAQQTRTRDRNINLEEYLSSAYGQRPGRASGMSEILIRSNPFIEGKKTWPRDSAHGLKMDPKQEGANGFATFTFTHEPIYQELEAKFFDLVRMGDPMQLVNFLQKYPYHISTLIQVSRYARDSDQNQALAADLIERALFTFGRVTLTGFRKKLEQGKARIDFLCRENRELYLAGYNHIRNLTQKGTVRTALEWTKLLFSLDPKDPYGLINFLHPLAIRANEAKWFINLATTTPLLDYKLPTGWYIKQTLVLAYLQLNNQDLAREALLSGINKLPWLYCSLFSALNLDTPKSVWGIKARDEKDEFNTALYLHMTKDLWDNPTTISFLKSVASTAPRNEDYMNLPPSPQPNLATERFVYLDSTPTLLSALPRNTTIGGGSMSSYDFDPLPPAGTRRYAGGSVPTAEQAREARAQAARMLAGDSEHARQVTRMMLDTFLNAAQAGATDMESQFQDVADMMRGDPGWFARFRAEYDREMDAWRARNNSGGAAAAADAAGGGRPFQATVEDGEDDDDNELPPPLMAQNDGNNDTSQEARDGMVNNLFRRAANLFGGGGGGQRGGETDVHVTDTQGLPEPVYRALEDLGLPDMPGAWGASDDGDETFPWEADADYSAITGQRPGNGHDDDAGRG
ncbi:Transcriptional repressor TCF25 domain containing protein [Rhypophila decipiens]